MINQTKNFVFAIAALAVGVIGSTSVQAQTQNILVEATVSNTLTLGGTNMNFGTFAMFSDTTETATVTIDVAGNVTAAASGTPAAAAVIDDTTAAAGQVTIADGAPGATLNITIDNVTDPTNGADTLVLDGFTTSYNGVTPAVPQTIGAAFTVTFDDTFGSGVNTLDIGATLTSPTAAVGALSDTPGLYSGDFDVIVSY